MLKWHAVPELCLPCCNSLKKIMLCSVPKTIEYYSLSSVHLIINIIYCTVLYIHLSWPMSFLERYTGCRYCIPHHWLWFGRYREHKRNAVHYVGKHRHAVHKYVHMICRLENPFTIYPENVTVNCTSYSCRNSTFYLCWSCL